MEGSESETRPFVQRLRDRIQAKAHEAAEEALAAQQRQEGDAGAPPMGAAPIPDLYTFTGFNGGDVVEQPGVAGKQWQLLYLDLPLTSWLLVERSGVMYEDTVTEDKAPDGRLNVLWVTGDAAVGIGSGSQSLEAQFLTGEFTRAADFRASPAGGTLAASTGVFCDAQSIGCCRPTKRT